MIFPPADNIVTYYTFEAAESKPERIIPIRFTDTNRKSNRRCVIMLKRLAIILLIIGGLNWGSIGLFKFDFVAYLFGGQLSSVSRVIYTLVGLSAIWLISLLFRDRDYDRDREHGERT